MFYASGNNFTLKVGPNWHPNFQLTALDMMAWQLGPNFPSWIQFQNNLKTLEMSNTGISVSIPPWFWEAFPEAGYLNLSRNQIHGDLSKSLSNSISWEFIDLSSNQLHGKLPHLSDGVYWLDLSSNYFSESMTDFICNKQFKRFELQFLNLASNNLSGKIPLTITNLNFLNKLDISYNHLKGKIPTGTQMQSFEASNFVGNNLCGPPLPINCSSSQQIPHINHIGTEHDGQHGVNWLFESMALGFIVGFWAVVAPLFIYRSWRYAYYHFLEDMWYKLQSYW